MKSFQSYSAYRQALLGGEFTCVEAVNYYLSNIDRLWHLNAFLEIYPDEARASAALIDQKIQSGEPLAPLAGMIIGLKDLLCHKDHHISGSSKILEGFVSRFSATAVERLIDAGAIIIGRQNCDEFGMGSSNENSAYGPVLHAQDPERVSGGSSGGSAVAVMADMCMASIGSDTGGSVRQPASFCGVVGLKPTYSRVSRWGLAAYASSFDCIGPITRSVADAALLLQIMAGADDQDSTASQKPVEIYPVLASQKPARALKIGWLKESFSPSIQAEIRQKMQIALDKLASAGHIVEGVEFPLLQYILPTYYILTMAEASSNLSRYDGIRYGYRSPNATDLESVYKKSRSEGFGAEVQRRIMLGTFVMSASYQDAYFTKAQKVRRLISEATQALFAKYDYLLMPAAPTTAFKFGQNNDDPIASFLGDVFTVQANLTGVPAICIPIGNDAEGLPVGMQIMGPAFGESGLLSLANQIEQWQEK